MSLYRAMRPLLFTLPPERAHRLTIRGLQMLGAVVTYKPEAPELSQSLMGLKFDNPFGMAAGFDKDGEAMAGVHGAGFGFTEIGTVTPLPQSGNPTPRVFRLPQDEALINRLGFNNQGHDRVARRLQAFRTSRPDTRVVGVNIGANKDAQNRIDDYQTGAARFGAMADYLTVNISSPNTPNLRDLQAPDAVLEIMQRVRMAAPNTPILVKIAPDLDMAHACEIGALALANNIDGLIISNTVMAEEGGLSGQPIFDVSTDMLSQVYAATQGKLTLIGVGGVARAAQAYAKIRAGASLVQLYTGLIYEGPSLVRRMKQELVQLLRQDGFETIKHAIGSDHK